MSDYSKDSLILALRNMDKCAECRGMGVKVRTEQGYFRWLEKCQCRKEVDKVLEGVNR